MKRRILIAKKGEFGNCGYSNPILSIAIKKLRSTLSRPDNDNVVVCYKIERTQNCDSGDGGF